MAEKESSGGSCVPTESFMSHVKCDGVLMRMRLAREAIASRADDDKPLVAGGEPQLCPEDPRRGRVSGHDPYV
jgi:hypothetical protein